jgi:branched-chain amino acid transport system ATP-binding protein
VSAALNARRAPVLALTAVNKSFGRTEIIRGVDLDIVDGERHALIGPNGAGKSTLFNLISGRLLSTSGNIALRGTDITRASPQAINRMGLARSFQVTNLFHRMTAFENLRCAALWSNGTRYTFWKGIDRLAAVNARAAQVLDAIGLARRRDVAASELTYAEQRALEIGVTIAGGADVILLDEPTAGMSRSEADAAVSLIRAVTAGKTLIMVEHDMDVVFGLADRVSVLVYGKIIATGVPEAIHDDAQVQEGFLGSALTKSRGSDSIDATQARGAGGAPHA